MSSDAPSTLDLITQLQNALLKRSRVRNAIRAAEELLTVIATEIPHVERALEAQLQDLQHVDSEVQHLTLQATQNGRAASA